jgi:hypothetical protein
VLNTHTRCSAAARHTHLSSVLWRCWSASQSAAQHPVKLSTHATAAMRQLQLQCILTLFVSQRCWNASQSAAQHPVKLSTHATAAMLQQQLQCILTLLSCLNAAGGLPSQQHITIVAAPSDAQDIHSYSCEAFSPQLLESFPVSSTAPPSCPPQNSLLSTAESPDATWAWRWATPAVSRC